MLRTRFAGVYDGVHVLTFFTPFDGDAAGFDPIDHTKVDPRLGSWDDVAELSKSHDIIVDAIVNHMSWESAQFQDVLKNGEKSEYYPMFLTMSSVFPNGATEEDLAVICRPRTGLPFTHYKFAGKTRLVWVSFTPQQVDIDTDSAKGWEYLMSIFDQMAASHVRGGIQPRPLSGQQHVLFGARLQRPALHRRPRGESRKSRAPKSLTRRGRHISRAASSCNMRPLRLLYTRNESAQEKRSKPIS